MNSMSSKLTWVDATKVELLQTLYKTGLHSHAKIGELLGGLSASIVSGKLRRLGYVGPDWTDAGIETLKTMWAVNAPTDEIAVATGMTPGQVLTKAGKLNLGRRTLPPRVRIRNRRKEPSSELTVYTPPKPRVCDVVFTPVSLVDRTGCCYPVGDDRPYMFCNNEGVKWGKSVDASIYCKGHWKYMHQDASAYHGKGVKSAHKATYK